MDDYESNYTLPVRLLLSAGEPEEPGLHYRELGLCEENVPDLIRLATDERLLDLDPLDVPAAWGPHHAILALGELGAISAIDPLLRLAEHRELDDEHFSEIPDALAMMGPAAIPILSAWVNDIAANPTARPLAATALAQIAVAVPEQRPACLQAVQGGLAHYRENEPDVNGFFVSSLLAMNAVEALPLIHEAYAAGEVDPFVVSWDEVREVLGTDLPDPSPDFEPLPTHMRPSRPPATAKKKAKRKQAKKSRRRNR